MSQKNFVPDLFFGLYQGNGIRNNYKYSRKSAFQIVENYSCEECDFFICILCN